MAFESLRSDLRHAAKRAVARVSDELQRAVARLPGASGRDASREGELRGEGKLRVVRGRGTARYQERVAWRNARFREGALRMSI